MEIIGWVYTICFAICYIPQIVKSLKTKKVNDISISLFVLSLIGYICAGAYTISSIGINAILLTNYIFGSICSLTMIIIYFMYGNRLNTDIIDMVDFNNSSYYRFLKKEQQEIDKLKWIESEKQGHDIGKEKAVLLWVKNYRAKWVCSVSKK
tara:strand:+ start:202 stop:657 length:456 start_codon:yes stop_codon:yes gene_type:complete